MARATESNSHINHSNELNITAWVFWLELIRQAGRSDLSGARIRVVHES